MTDQERFNELHEKTKYSPGGTGPFVIAGLVLAPISYLGLMSRYAPDTLLQQEQGLDSFFRHSFKESPGHPMPTFDPAEKLKEIHADGENAGFVYGSTIFFLVCVFGYLSIKSAQRQHWQDVGERNQLAYRIARQEDENDDGF